MRDYQALIFDYFSDPLARPLRTKELAQVLGLGKNDFKRFKDAVEELISDGRLLMGKNKLVRPAAPAKTIAGTIKRTGKGNGYFQPSDPAAASELGLEPGESLYISPEDLKDAFTGDEVLVQLLRSHMKGQRCGRVIEVISRGSQAFVGTYFERRDHGFVRIDGNQFEGPISVGDPGAKGVLPDDRVVVEMLRYPSRDDAGEAVVTKVLGPRGAPGVDLQTIIAEFGLPDEFPEAVLAEARLQAQMFEEESNEQRAMSAEADKEDDATPIGQPHHSPIVARRSPRLDLTNDLIITIDPIDARDFDDAISLTREEDGNWRLGVHIADVAHFVQSGTMLDKEARQRGTSVYLPDKVLPMLPEVISNALASLQAGRVRYTKSVFITFSPDGTPLDSEFANSKIKVRQRFAYEQVMPLISNEPVESDVDVSVIDLLRNMHSLAMTLRKRRFRGGSLDLNLPEIKVDMARDGKVLGAHRQLHDESHQIIEEFMLAANVAVATRLTDLGIPFLRRNHGAPDEMKLRILGEFAKSLGYKTKAIPGRADLQHLLADVQGTPHEYAISFATLRSMKQAVYGPEDDIGHYALAFENYCHFTSPIRRYPDLVVHRLMDEVIGEEMEEKGGRSGAGTEALRTAKTRRRQAALHAQDSGSSKSYPPELVLLGKWCSMTERRAQDAERELVKLKMLEYLSNHIGEQMDATITGVEKFGLFCTGIELPAEGLVHISTMADDHYDYDDRRHTLVGRRSGRTLRLGDLVEVVVAKVDLVERKLEMRLVVNEGEQSREAKPPRPRDYSRPSSPRKPKPYPTKGRRRGR